MAIISKVDVHHHIIPPEISGVDYGLKGMKGTEWNESDDKIFSETVGIRTSIFSVSVPGVMFVSDPHESTALARRLNEYSAALRDKDPHSYGFFASVPSLEYTDLVIREIKYAFDTLRADGVTLFTRYGAGDGYLGSEAYVPVWQELNARKAVVFVHPINNKNGVMFNDKLPMPLFDWPHETGRTAIDMILHRRLEQFPDVKIILSHAGGTLPALVTRSTMVAQPEFGGAMGAEDILNQAKRFYFDLALSGSKEVLPLILGFAEKGHILFGSDYPHATDPVSRAHAKFIDEYEMDVATRKEIYHGTAELLFPRLTGIFDA